MDKALTKTVHSFKNIVVNAFNVLFIEILVNFWELSWQFVSKTKLLITSFVVKPDKSCTCEQIIAGLVRQITISSNASVFHNLYF